jgi:hypothetical protein
MAKMKHNQDLEEQLNHLALLWDSPPQMMTEGMSDSTRVSTRALPLAHHHRPYHRHQTGQLHRSCPVHCFGH